MITDLLRAGLRTIKGISLKSYRELAKQLGDYYLLGPQLWINRLLSVMEAYQIRIEESYLKEAIHALHAVYTDFLKF